MKLFGTDGVRGIANTEPMTPETVLKLGKSLVYHLIAYKHVKHPKIVIGKDTRLSGYMFEQTLSAAITSMGADVYLVGPLPTPAISFITTSMRADAGVVISASHNPYTDNGIKFFASDGFKFDEHNEQQIEDILFSKEYQIINNSEIGKAFRINDAQGRYISYLKNTVPADFNLHGIKIVLDCANGAGYKVAPAVFEELGAEVITIFNEPDGKNINTKNGALYPQELCETVKNSNADIGIALDGDADRAVFVDSLGRVIDGDEIIAMCIRYFRDNGNACNTFVFTEMSNIALQKYVKSLGSEFVLTDVGDKYVVDKMRETGSVFGGEKSGHYIFMDYSTTGDGILSALQVLYITNRCIDDLHNISDILELYPQLLLSVKVREKAPFDSIPALAEEIDICSKILGDDGRINLRYSGTEQLLRVMVEGKDKDQINKIASDISQIINKHIGVED